MSSGKSCSLTTCNTKLAVTTFTTNTNPRNFKSHKQNYFIIYLFHPSCRRFRYSKYMIFKMHIRLVLNLHHMIPLASAHPSKGLESTQARLSETSTSTPLVPRAPPPVLFPLMQAAFRSTPTIKLLCCRTAKIYCYTPKSGAYTGGSCGVYSVTPATPTRIFSSAADRKNDNMEVTVHSICFIHRPGVTGEVPGTRHSHFFAVLF